jgi:hypothetical protein
MLMKASRRLVKVSWPVDPEASMCAYSTTHRHEYSSTTNSSRPEHTTTRGERRCYRGTGPMTFNVPVVAWTKISRIRAPNAQYDNMYGSHTSYSM